MEKESELTIEMLNEAVRQMEAQPLDPPDVVIFPSYQYYLDYCAYHKIEPLPLEEE